MSQSPPHQHRHPCLQVTSITYDPAADTVAVVAMWKGRWMGLPLKVHLHLQHAQPQHTHARLHLHPHLHTHMHIRHTDALVRVVLQSNPILLRVSSGTREHEAAAALPLARDGLPLGTFEAIPQCKGSGWAIAGRRLSSTSSLPLLGNMLAGCLAGRHRPRERREAIDSGPAVLRGAERSPKLLGRGCR